MEEYINQLLIDAGVPDDLDPEVRAQLMSDLTTRAANLINRRLVDAMSESDAEELEKLLEEKPEDAAALEQFVDAHVPNKEQVVAGALLELRMEYLGDKA